MKFNPRTNPTKSQLAQMKQKLEFAIDTFGVSGFAHLCDVKPVAVRAWRLRGRISATAANTFCKTHQAKEWGFTREEMRPDVLVWYIDSKE